MHDFTEKLIGIIINDKTYFDKITLLVSKTVRNQIKKKQVNIIFRNIHEQEEKFEIKTLRTHSN